MEIKIGNIEGEQVNRRTRIDILTDEEEKIRLEREQLENERQKKEVRVAKACLLSIPSFIYYLCTALSLCTAKIFSLRILCLVSCFNVNLDSSFGV